MRRQVGFGILLILVGLGLLFLFIISGYTWDWTALWPSIFLLLGILDIIEHGWHGLRGGGGFMVLLGCFLLLFTMRLVPWPLRQAWPAGLILLGLLSLLGDDPSLSWAIILIGGGSFILALTTGRLVGGWRQFWPVILILAGLVALVSHGEKPHREPRVPPAETAPRSMAASETDPPNRLEVLARIRAGEISVEEGVAILEGREKKDGPKT